MSRVSQNENGRWRFHLDMCPLLAVPASETQMEGGKNG
jgi:hypothetical protein